MREKILPMVALAVALVVAGPAAFAQHAPDPNPAGSIQGAMRYHDTQITRADVQVAEDELAARIQSDTFDTIAKDPNAGNIAPLEAINGRNIAPLEAPYGHYIAPLEAINGRNIAPLEAPYGHYIAPLEAINGRNIAPLEAPYGHYIAPLE